MSNNISDVKGNYNRVRDILSSRYEEVEDMIIIDIYFLIMRMRES